MKIKFYIFTILLICLFVILISGCKEKTIDLKTEVLKNLSICNNASEPHYREACMYRVSRDYGNLVKSPEECKEVPEKYHLVIDACYFEASHHLNDSSICKLISVKGSTAGVIASGGIAPDISEQLCLIPFLNKNDPEYCNKTVPDDHNYNGVNSVYAACIRGLAVRLKNIDLCLALDNGHTAYLSDQCILEYAIAVNDSTLCDKIWGNNEKAGCLANVK